MTPCNCMHVDLAFICLGLANDPCNCMSASPLSVSASPMTHATACRPRLYLSRPRQWPMQLHVGLAFICLGLANDPCNCMSASPLSVSASPMTHATACRPRLYLSRLICLGLANDPCNCMSASPLSVSASPITHATACRSRLYLSRPRQWPMQLHVGLAFICLGLSVSASPMTHATACRPRLYLSRPRQCSGSPIFRTLLDTNVRPIC